MHSIFVLRKPGLHECLTLDDLLEIGCFSGANIDPDRRLAILYGFEKSDDAIVSIIEAFGIQEHNVWLQPDALPPGVDQLTLAAALVLVLVANGPHTGDVFDVNLDKRTQLGSTPVVGQIAQCFDRLSQAYREQQVGTCIDIIQKIYGLTHAVDCTVASHLRIALDPIEKFFTTYYRLMISLPSSLDVSVVRPTEATTLKTLHPHEEVGRIRDSAKRLVENDASVDAVQKTVAFFNVGIRSLNGIGARSSSAARDAVKVFFSWASVYSFAASKASIGRRDGHSALLYAFRALEFYVLAHLWRMGRLNIERNRLVIHGRPSLGFQEVWTEFSDSRPTPLPAEISTQIDQLRAYRNCDFLTHGFLSLTDAQILSARGAVKAAIYHWESEYPQRLIEGPLESFLEGERWHDELGRKLASRALVDSGYIQLAH